MIKLKSLLSELAIRLNSIKEVESIKKELAIAAQNQYNQWNLDDDGYDFEVGSGGICHLIADKMIDVLYKHNIHRCQTVSSNHEQHVYIVGQFREGIFSIDIPPHLYETGGGYTWKKIPDVQFDEDFIDISCLDRNPRRFNLYIDSN